MAKKITKFDRKIRVKFPEGFKKFNPYYSSMQANLRKNHQKLVQLSDSSMADGEYVQAVIEVNQKDPGHYTAYVLRSNGVARETKYSYDGLVGLMEGIGKIVDEKYYRVRN